jgi:hypothetical protein
VHVAAGDEQLAVRQVGVAHDAPLLVQHAVDVAQHAAARWSHAALVFSLVEVQNRKVALHDLL